MDTSRELKAITHDPAFSLTTSLRWTTSLDEFPAFDITPDTSLPQLSNLALRLHIGRLFASADTFNLTNAKALISARSAAWFIAEISSHISSKHHTPSITPKDPEKVRTYKVTISVSPTADISLVFLPIHPPLYPFIFPSEPPSTLSTLTKVYLSPQHTPSSPFTTHKTSHRPHYESVRSALCLTSTPPTTAESLLYNTLDEITEGTVCTVYFRRSDKWITPASHCGGNMGVTRALALEKGWCTEGVVRKEDVMDGEVVVLSNGVRGYWYGKITSASPNYPETDTLNQTLATH